jgi:hypothetical protein
VKDAVPARRNYPSRKDHAKSQKIKPHDWSNIKLFYLEAGKLGMNLLESQSPALSVIFHP